MTRKMRALDSARQIARNRDMANTMESRQYWEWLFDAAIEDLRIISGWYRKAARKRLRRMRTA